MTGVRGSTWYETYAGTSSSSHQYTHNSKKLSLGTCTLDYWYAKQSNYQGAAVAADCDGTAVCGCTDHGLPQELLADTAY